MTQGSFHYVLVLATLPVQLLLVRFYFKRKLPPLKKTRFYAALLVVNLALTIGGLLSQFSALYILNYLCLLVTLTMYFGAQNPELFLEKRTNTFNRQAFEAVMEENSSRRYSLVSFAIHKYTEVRGLYGAHQVDACLGQIGTWLVRTFPELSVYYLRQGRFVLLSFGPIDEADITERLRARFVESWQVGEGELFFDIDCALMDSSACAGSVDNLISCIEIAHHQQEKMAVPPKEPVRVNGKYVDDLRREMAVKRALEYAVAHDTVEVYLQPIVGAQTQRIVGAEALARIHDKKLGLIPPAVFIPIAEKDGSIQALGKQMFRKVCAFMSEEKTRALDLDWVNVNLSPIQCMNPHLADEFIAIQRQYAVPASMIHLEITEESIINLNTLQNQIEKLRAAGFSFVLDDYGSGYSNLTLVRQIPFVNIKIDMSLVRDHFKKPDTLLPDTIRAFRELGMSITAEGVETAYMANALDHMDATYLQGYHYAKPMPMKDFYAYVSKREDEEDAACMASAS